MAAITVALAHYRISLPYDLQSFVMWHNAAVDLFFVLSGFTLCYAYGLGSGERLPLRKYLVARVARIYPLYLLTLVVIWFVYVSRVMGQTQYPPGQAALDFLAQAIGVNAWPILGNGVHWNSPAWSVSVEILCYVAVFPLLFRLPLLRNPVAIMAIAVAAMCLSYWLFAQFFDPILLDIRAYEAPSWVSYWVNPMRGVLGFVAGWLAYCAFIEKGTLAAACQAGFDLVLLALFVALIGAHFGWWPVQVIVLLFPAIILGASGGSSLGVRVLSSQVANYLGEISYSIYLVHIILYVDFLLNVGPPEAWTLRTYLLLITLLMIVSPICYYGFERPLRSLIRIAWAEQPQLKSADRAASRAKLGA